MGVSEELVQRLYAKISSPYNVAYASGLAQKLEEAKFYYALNNVPNTQFINNNYPCCSVQLSAEEGFQCGINNGLNTTNAINKDVLLNVYKELFGESLNDINNKYYDNNKLSYYAYDSSNDNFIWYVNTLVEELTN